jgi:hypothetical protein
MNISEVKENDFIHKSGEVLFRFEIDDAEVDDIFKFVTMPITKYKNVVMMRDIKAYSISDNDKRVNIRKDHKFPLVQEVSRGSKRGLFFITRSRVYYLPEGSY